MRTDQELAAYIGLDWGDQRHAVQIHAAAGGPVDQLELEQPARDPAASRRWQSPRRHGESHDDRQGRTSGQHRWPT